MRGQAPGHQGNQKTPTFACSILLQVIMHTHGTLPMQGSTTDVGLHTGCCPRNTSFPLVLSTVQTMLRWNGERDDEVFNKCILVYYLLFLKTMVPSIAEYHACRIDQCITIIQEIKPTLLIILDEKFKGMVVEQMETYRTLLNLMPSAKDCCCLPDESVA